MKQNLEILAASALYAPTRVEELHTKELVPKMTTRRRLTRAAKLVLELAHRSGFEQGRILYGSAYGELPATAAILRRIDEGEPISPTDFQNSVYNTAVSYLSMITKNRSEIMTVSSGDETAKALLQAAAVKAMDGDTLFVSATETLDIEKIEQVNRCIDYLESGAGFILRATDKPADLSFGRLQPLKGFAPSLACLIDLAQRCSDKNSPVLEVEL